MSRIVVLSLMCAALVFAQRNEGRHGKQPPPPPPPPLVTTISEAAANWTVERDDASSPNVPLHPTALPGNVGWSLAIPRSPKDANPCTADYPQCVWLGYITTPYTGPLLVGHSIAATTQVVATSGTPSVSFETETDNTCPAPASLHFFFRVKNPNPSGSETDEWWYDPASFPLAPGGGPITITAMINGAYWSDTFGHFGNDPAYSAAFAAALKNVGVVGVTAGGGCFFGHGVFTVGGTANLELISIGVN